MKKALILGLISLSAIVHAGFPIIVGDPLEIDPTHMHSAVRLEFNSETGKYYQVQITDDLVSGTWDNEGYSVKGTGGTLDVLVSTRAYSPAFFQVHDGGDPANVAPTGPQGIQGPPGPKGDPADPAPIYTAAAPLNIDTNNLIGLNPASQDGDVLTFSSSGNHWLASRPGHLSVITTELSNVQPYNTVRYIIALVGQFPSPNGTNPFLAEIIMFGGNFAPEGWAFCDGQLLAISQNSALFSLLGTTYGGDGETTFGLPDLRGRVAIHPGSGPGLTPYAQGQKGGAEKSQTHRH